MDINGDNASNNDDRSGGNVDRLGPMCSSDCPDRDVANFFVSSVDKSCDWVRNCTRRDWRYGVEFNAEEVLCTSLLLSSSLVSSVVDVAVAPSGNGGGGTERAAEAAAVAAVKDDAV